MVDNIYERLSQERKEAQDRGEYPDWFTTGGYQMFKESYEYQAVGYKGQIQRVAETLSRYAVPFIPESHPLYNAIVINYGDNWEDCFFNIMWQNHFDPSTPVLANTGTDRGCSVSCSGQVVGDSIKDFYEARKTAALLGKEGFGTSAYLGGIRPRGAPISKGGKAEGTTPVKRGLQQDARDVSQAGVRRGAVACYLPLDHPDFDEWCDDLIKNHQGQNIGWNFSRKVIEAMEYDPEMNRRRAKTLYARCLVGKGYWWKTDHVNEQQPQCYKDHGLTNKASNLCTEITLHADEDHDYTCIISSMNALHFDVWKNTGAVFVATVFLDALCSEFIAKAKKIEGLENAVRYTEKARSLGLGLLGFHSYLQSKMIAFEELKAYFANQEIFQHIQKESIEASRWMAEVDGEPEWCKGYGIRSTHLVAVAPNVSSATLAGQVSQGIEPWIANVFLQPTSAGELLRVNPQFLELAKSKGKYNKALVRDLIDNKGSVQHLPWLTDHEKLVFKTAFEIDQKTILRLASDRQRFIDQGQSLNLFFSADESEEYIAEVHKEFLLDPYLKGLYYLRSESGVMASKDCVSCAS